MERSPEEHEDEMPCFMNGKKRKRAEDCQHEWPGFPGNILDESCRGLIEKITQPSVDKKIERKRAVALDGINRLGWIVLALIR